MELKLFNLFSFYQHNYNIWFNFKSLKILLQIGPTKKYIMESIMIDLLIANSIF